MIEYIKDNNNILLIGTIDTITNNFNNELILNYFD